MLLNIGNLVYSSDSFGQKSFVDLSDFMIPKYLFIAANVILNINSTKSTNILHYTVKDQISFESQS